MFVKIIAMSLLWKLSNMKSSVKDQDYKIGTKVYWSDNADVLRGTIVKSMKIAVHLKLPDGSIEKVDKLIIKNSILVNE